MRIYQYYGQPTVKILTEIISLMQAQLAHNNNKDRILISRLKRSDENHASRVSVFLWLKHDVRSNYSYHALTAWPRHTLLFVVL